MMGFSPTTETETETPPPLQSKPHPPLHNFSLPFLKWEGQRRLRCMKYDPIDRRSPPSEPTQSSGSGSSPIRVSVRKPSTPAPLEKLRTVLPRIGALKPEGEAAGGDSADDGIEEIRVRLLDHLRSAADKMRFRVPEEDEESTAMPWNLRTRRAACKAPTEISPSPLPPPPPPPPLPHVQENQMRSMRSRAAAAAAAAAASAAAQGAEKVKEKRKLNIALSREEIEEDFFAMTGSKPARRPKKRLGKVQRQLETTFPGLWLSEITLDTYRVPETQEHGKR